MNVQHLTNEEKLNEIFRMTEENNGILRSIRRQQYVSNVFRFLYWILIIASVGGAYYFIKPIISSFTGGSASGFGETLNQLNSLKSQLPEARVIQEMLNGVNSPQN
jgi:hypothetical protein